MKTTYACIHTNIAPISKQMVAILFEVKFIHFLMVPFWPTFDVIIQTQYYRKTPSTSSWICLWSNCILTLLYLRKHNKGEKVGGEGGRGKNWRPGNELETRE